MWAGQNRSRRPARNLASNSSPDERLGPLRATRALTSVTRGLTSVTRGLTSVTRGLTSGSGHGGIGGPQRSGINGTQRSCLIPCGPRLVFWHRLMHTTRRLPPASSASKDSGAPKQLLGKFLVLVRPVWLALMTSVQYRLPHRCPCADDSVDS